MRIAAAPPFQTLSGPLGTFGDESIAAAVPVLPRIASGAGSEPVEGRAPGSRPGQALSLSKGRRRTWHFQNGSGFPERGTRSSRRACRAGRCLVPLGTSRQARCPPSPDRTVRPVRGPAPPWGQDAPLVRQRHQRSVRRKPVQPACGSAISARSAANQSSRPAAAPSALGPPQTSPAGLRQRHQRSVRHRAVELTHRRRESGTTGRSAVR